MNYILFIGSFLLLILATGNGLCRFLKAERNIADQLLAGFVFILVLFYLSALPFMLTRGSFNVLCQLFTVLLSLVTAALIWLFWHKRKQPLKKNIIASCCKKRLIIWIAALALIAGQVVLVVMLKHQDADDAFYLGVTNAILDSNRIFAFEPSTGNPLLPFPTTYTFTGYEVLMAYFARLFSLNTAVLYHTVMPILIIPLAYLAAYSLGKRLLDDGLAPYFLIMLSLLNLFGGYSAYLQSSFLLFRAWQGKAILVNVLFPYFFSLFIDFADAQPGKRRSADLLLVFAMLAASSLSAVGVYLLPIAFGCLVLAYTLYHRTNRILVRACLIILPSILLAGLVLLRIRHADIMPKITAVTPNQALFWDSWALFAKPGFYYILYIPAALLAILRGNARQKHMLVVYPAIILLTILNPLFSSFVGTYVTGIYVYWRLFWLIPCFYGLAYLGAILFEQTKTRLQQTAFVALMVLFLSLSGQWIITRANFDYSGNPEKINPAAISLATQALAKLAEPVILAPPDLAIEIRQYTGAVVLVWSRDNYVREAYASIGDNQSADTLQALNQFLYGESNDPAVLDHLADFNINVVILPNDSPKRGALQETAFTVVYESDHYMLLTYP